MKSYGIKTGINILKEKNNSRYFSVEDSKRLTFRMVFRSDQK